MADRTDSARRVADPYVGAARAALGQGLGMGWGDEAEAWLRSKLGEGRYEDLVKRIRSEYGQYAEENPFTSGALEFVGGVAPGVAAAFLPGGQPVAASQAVRGASVLSRLAASPLARATAAGAVTGGVTGAGVADDGDRASGAASGTILGAALGFGTPVGLRASGAGYDWLRQRLAPSEKTIERSAVKKMLSQMQDTGMSPADIEAQLKRDRALGVPSMIANTNPALVNLAEAVAQRGRKGSVQLEEALGKQKSGARQRVYQQVDKGLAPGDYFADEQKFVSNLRANANTAYDKAYSVGEVDDPTINTILSNPMFAKFYEKARSIADTEALAAKLEGKDPSKYQLRQVYKPIYETDPQTGLPVIKGFERSENPDVRTLDYIKRGIDATIDSGMRGGGLSSSEANALKQLRNVFRDRLDIIVPEYKKARNSYGGDLEVVDALRMGMNDFGKLKHEQVIDLMSNMSAAEKAAFRTGVARHLYGKVMEPTNDINPAKRIINAPENENKLRALFDNPSDFNLFNAALNREMQLYQQAGKIIGGSQTHRRGQVAKSLDADTTVADVVSQSITGGPWNSLTGFVARAINAGAMTEDVADKLASMLIAKNPNDVAAAVKLLEKYSQKAPKEAGVKRAVESGAATGAATSIYPPPATEKPEEPGRSIEEDINALTPEPGMSIEDAIRQEEEGRKFAEGGEVKKNYSDGNLVGLEKDSAGSYSDPLYAARGQRRYGGSGSMGSAISSLYDLALNQARSELKGAGPRAITDVANGLVADYLGVPVDMANTALGMVGLGSSQPIGGSRQMRDLMSRYGVTSGTERPMTETAVSLLGPGAPRALTKVANAATVAARRPFTPLTLTAEATAPDLGQNASYGFRRGLNDVLLPEMKNIGRRSSVDLDVAYSPADTLEGVGTYVNKANKLETNPMLAVYIPGAGRVGVPPKGKIGEGQLVGDVTGSTQELRRKIAQAGVDLNQEAMAAHRFIPLPVNTPKDASAMLISTREGLDKDRIAKLADLLGKNMVVAHNPRLGGVVVYPFDKVGEGVPAEFAAAKSAAETVLGKKAQIRYGVSDYDADRLYMQKDLGDYEKAGAGSMPAEQATRRRKLQGLQKSLYPDTSGIPGNVKATPIGGIQGWSRGEGYPTHVQGIGNDWRAVNYSTEEVGPRRATVQEAQEDQMSLLDKFHRSLVQRYFQDR